VNARRVLAVLAIAELLAMTPWFSASAVAPTLARVWQLSPVTTAWLTISVQLGFVAGALVSAIFTFADRLSARRLVAGSAALAAIATLGVAASSGITLGIACRLLTGAALAGVYPPGMKIAAGWFKEGRGLAIGILVGALGESASRAVGSLPGRVAHCPHRGGAQRAGGRTLGPPCTKRRTIRRAFAAV